MSPWNRICAASAFLLLPIATLAQLNLGDRLTPTQIPKNNTSHCAATPSQTYPCVADLTVDGVKFATVGYDAKTGRIQYLLTSDSHFKTKEGLRVGDWIEVSEDQVVSLDGWHIFGPTSKDGWRIILGTTLLGSKTVKFQDGTDVFLKPTRTGPPRIGKVRILQFEKGGV